MLTALSLYFFHDSGHNQAPQSARQSSETESKKEHQKAYSFFKSQKMKPSKCADMLKLKISDLGF